MPQSVIPAFDVHSDEPLSTIPPQSVVLSSAGSGWDGLLVEQYSHPAMEMREMYLPGHLLTLQISRPLVVEFKTGGRFQGARMTPGDLCLMPALSPVQGRWTAPLEVLAISLEPRLLTRVAYEILPEERIEIVGRQGVPDARLQALGMALKAEIEDGGASGALYGDSIATALAVHLLHRHNAYQTSPLPPSPRGLAPSQLRLAKEYIHEHLGSNMTLAEIARETGFSPSYFNTLFKQSTGLTAHAYVVQQRVEWAKRLLLRGDLTIGEVAAQTGFADQSHLTRQMNRLLKVTPQALIRRQG